MDTKQPDVSGLKSLGDQTVKYSYEYDPSVLETFDSPTEKSFYVSFDQRGEFTSLCPKTNQADYADIRFLYKPYKKCVESKSLKLYLASYRNEKGFGETITNTIADDLAKLLDPDFIVVIGAFKARGGIAWATEAIRTRHPYVWTPMDLIQVEKFR